MVVEGGGGGGRVRGSCDLGASLEDDPLFRPTMRSYKPFRGFKDIGSSSLELLSTSEIINWGERATKAPSSSPSESGISTGSSHTSSSSLSRNWSISSPSDKHEEAISSLGVAVSGKAWWRGNSTSERSTRARKPVTETSILRSWGSPALMVLPTSWKVSDSGSNRGWGGPFSTARPHSWTPQTLGFCWGSRCWPN